MTENKVDDFKDRDAKIEKALAQTKEDLQLCEGFDEAVEKARNMSFVERLGRVALVKGRKDVFEHFQRVLASLDEPVYAAPEVPSVGDYVRLTMADSTVREGKVRVVSDEMPNRQYRPIEIKLEGADNRGYIYQDNPGNFNLHWQIVKVEKLPKPVEIPEIGKWIEATDAEGTTKIIEVNLNTRHTLFPYTLIGGGDSNFDSYYARIADAGYEDRTKRGNIVSWKYVDAPVVPVEIDGYWVINSPEFNTVRAYLTEEEAKTDCPSQAQARTVEEAYTSISSYAQTTYNRRYIPAMLAVIKFIEQEEGK